MRTFLVVVFALAAVAMGGMWLISQTEPADGSLEVMSETEAGIAMDEADAPMEEAEPEPVVEMAPPPPPPPAPAAPSTRSLGAGSDGAPDTADAETGVSVASAPPPAPEPVVATQSLAEQFRSREVTYNRPPKTLALDHPIDVSLVINATDEEGAGAAALDGFDGTIVERDVELTDVVSAQLTGVGFDIVEQTVERQRLSPRVLNRWQWRVTPTKEGTQTLVLEIFGYADGAFEGEPLDAYRDEIVVEVKNLDRLISFARDYEPVFAIGAGVAGGLSALFGFLRFRSDRKRRKTS